LLADLMGGSVGVESHAGEGARFWLRLPLTIAMAPVERATANLPNTTVLVVEDTDYNAWAAEAVLGKLGLTCERARTGAEALEMFGAKRFNVVLLDRNLPDLDGTEVARRMREMETDGSHAVLLAVTAYCTAEDRALCLESGMDAFVGKPLTPEKLRRTLLDAGRRLISSAPAQMAPTPPPVVSPSRQLDWSLFQYLSDGTPESFEAQVRRFLAELRDAETDLCDAHRADDHKRIRTAVHRLIGHATTIGDAALETACQDLQTAARAGDRRECEELLARVRAELAGLTAAMHHRSAARSA
jgi:CheY-like chemotaxis protein